MTTWTGGDPATFGPGQLGSVQSALVGIEVTAYVDPECDRAISFWLVAKDAPHPIAFSVRSRKPMIDSGCRTDFVVEARTNATKITREPCRFAVAIPGVLLTPDGKGMTLSVVFDEPIRHPFSDFIEVVEVWGSAETDPSLELQSGR